MYAVKGGHIDTVKGLMECEFLKYDLQNKVCAQPYPPTPSLFFYSPPPPPPPPTEVDRACLSSSRSLSPPLPLQLTCSILSYS